MNSEISAAKAAERLDLLQSRIRAAAARANRRPEEITLLAVSKSKPVEAIQALASLGQKAFGENYLQEAMGKIQSLAESPNHEDRDLAWHFIGPLQSNKTRDVARLFHWAQTVDRLKIARRLSEQRPSELPPLQVCLQVNISGEPQKAGVAAEQLSDLADAVSQLDGLRLRGLMCLPAPSEDETKQRAPFAALRELMHTQNQRGHQMDTLSMGMSGDLEAAILEGSTLIRVGSALFGARD